MLNSRVALLLVISLQGLIVPFTVLAESSEVRGYYWYEDPVKTEEISEQRQPLPAPPPTAEMMKMHPEDIEVLLQDYLKEAVWLQTPDTVLNYYKIQDVARRKASGFTALASLVIQENPALNGKSQYPTNQPGSIAEAKHVNQTRRQKLQSARQRFGLAMFTSPDCPYCKAQRNILRYFQDTHGWEFTELDITENPEVQARFNVSVTPMIIMIERRSDRWMPIGVGVESAANLEINTYRAVRYLDGEVTPQQFLTPEHRMGGFFDPTAEG